MGLLFIFFFYQPANTKQEKTGSQEWEFYRLILFKEWGFFVEWNIWSDLTFSLKKLIQARWTVFSTLFHCLTRIENSPLPFHFLLLVLRNSLIFSVLQILRFLFCLIRSIHSTNFTFYALINRLFCRSFIHLRISAFLECCIHSRKVLILSHIMIHGRVFIIRKLSVFVLLLLARVCLNCDRQIKSYLMLNVLKILSFSIIYLMVCFSSVASVVLCLLNGLKGVAVFFWLLLLNSSDVQTNVEYLKTNNVKSF